MAEPSGGVLLQVRNHHSLEAGTPPRSDDAPTSQYIGYFENVYGEQAVFVFDHSARTATLYMGDASWETGHRVINGIAPDLVLNDAEQLWLRTRWHAATGKDQ